MLELVRGDMVPHIVSRELIALVGRQGARARRRRHGAAGARHVPRRRRARRHDPLLPAQNLSARPAQLGGAFRHLHHGHDLGDRRPQLAAAAGQMGADQGQRDQERRDVRQVRLRDGDDARETAAQRQCRASPASGRARCSCWSSSAICSRSSAPCSRRCAAGSACRRIRGVHLERGDEIRIEGHQSNVILDGEMFEAEDERPIVLRPTAPVPFLRLAA